MRKRGSLKGLLQDSTSVKATLNMKFVLITTLGFAALRGQFTFAQTWTLTSAPITNWHAVASSADGARLVAVSGGAVQGGPIFISTNSGATWMPSSAPIQKWYSVASSADGTRLIATPSSGGVTYMSADSGVTWTPANVETS